MPKSQARRCGQKKMILELQGKFIRKVRIDELPQSWSVLKGEMSFVGPRPERPQFVEELQTRMPFYAERHIVKPGITGWAQVHQGHVHEVNAVVDAIFYVAATGCQWRALPEKYPNWNTVHRLHLRGSRDGTWEAIADRLRGLVRSAEGRDPEPSAGIIDARSTQGASTVTRAVGSEGQPGRGYDAGKKVSGRKTFGVVDTLGLLVSVFVVAASTSDNAGGAVAVDRAATKSRRLQLLWTDAGFKKAFATHCQTEHQIKATVVKRGSEPGFHVLPKRWVVERTFGWLGFFRRLSKEYEELLVISKSVLYSAMTQRMLKQLTLA